MRIEDFTEAKIKEIFEPFLEYFGLTIKEIKDGPYWDKQDDADYVPEGDVALLSIVFDENPTFYAITIIYEKPTNGLWGILYNKKMNLEIFEYRPLPKGYDIVPEEYYKILIQKRIAERLGMFGFYPDEIDHSEVV